MQKKGIRKRKDSDQLYSLISFVKISKNRLSLIKELEEKPFFPSELVRRLKINFSTVSKNLRQLEEKDIVFCITPGVKKGKFYSLIWSTPGHNLKRLL